MADDTPRWLQARLVAAFPSVEAWVVESLVPALLACATQAEAVETVSNFLGPSGATDALVSELFTRTAAVPPTLIVGDRVATAYVKPPRDGPSVARPTRRAPPPATPTPAASAPSTSAAATAPPPPPPRVGPPPPKGRARKAAAAAAAADAKPFDANGGPSAPPTWLGRVVNCLRCGYIHDLRGPPASLAPPLVVFATTNACVFCGAFVAPDGFDGGGDAAGAASAAAASARLVAFDRGGGHVTRVVDDQADYVTAEDANPWLSEEEKQARRDAVAAAAAKAEAKKRVVKISVDWAGRQVIDAASSDEEGGDARRNTAELDDAAVAGAPHAASVAAPLAPPSAPPLAAGADNAPREARSVVGLNPSVSRRPRFVPPPEAAGRLRAAAAAAPPASAAAGDALEAWLVQDDDPFEMLARAHNEEM